MEVAAFCHGDTVDDLGDDDVDDGGDDDDDDECQWWHCGHCAVGTVVLCSWGGVIGVTGVAISSCILLCAICHRPHVHAGPWLPESSKSSNHVANVARIGSEIKNFIAL